MKREVKIGLTGIVALVLLFWGINFLKGIDLFSTSDSYYITFSNSKGLAKSSAVYADGFNIGIVDAIDYVGPGKVVVKVNVDEGVKIPVGTVAQLTEALLGGCTLNLTMGANPANCYLPGDTIAGGGVPGLMDAVGDVMPDVQQVLAHVDSLILALNALAANPDLPQIMANARMLTENLNRSTDNLNSLLTNDLPQLTATFNATGENLDTLTHNLAQIDLQQTLNKVDTTLNALNEATAKLTSPDNNIGLLLTDTALYNNINNTLGSATLLLEDFKAHPKRYINVSVFGRKSKD